jgi:hypothetical protein
MSILSLIKKPATGAQQLRQRLEQLKSTNPFEHKAAREADRKAALLNGDTRPSSASTPNCARCSWTTRLAKSP